MIDGVRKIRKRLFLRDFDLYDILYMLSREDLLNLLFQIFELRFSATAVIFGKTFFEISKLFLAFYQILSDPVKLLREKTFRVNNDSLAFFSPDLIPRGEGAGAGKFRNISEAVILHSEKVTCPVHRCSGTLQHPRLHHEV